MVNLSIFRAVLPSLSVFRQGLGAGVCLWVLGGILQVGPIQAHSLGESYLVLSVYEDSLRGQVEVTLSDLDKALGLDRDGDGKISAGEIEGQIEVAKAYVAANTALDAYQVQFVDWELVEVPLGRFAAFKFAVDLVEPPPPVLDIEFKLLFERDPQHRGFLVVEYNYVTGAVNKSEEISAIFTPSAPGSSWF